MATFATAAMLAVGTLAKGIGSAIDARGTLAAGKAQQDMANYEAAQMDVQAKDERAIAQREALAIRRQRNLALSALTARGAASGFSATDPTAMRLAGEIAKYGTYQEQIAKYGGDVRAANLTTAATGRRIEGAAARTGSRYAARGTIVGGISTMFDRFASFLPEPKTGTTSASPNYRYGVIRS